MLRLLERVDQWDAARSGRPPNAWIAAARARQYPGDGALPPEFLTSSQARRLIDFVTSAGATAPLRWQDVRNRTAVALQLGAGITPGEARELTLGQVRIDGGHVAGEPWALDLPANGNFSERQTPLAGWAGRQLVHWLRVRAEQGIPGEAVFPSTRSGKTWSKPSSIRAFQEVLSGAGVSSVGGSFKLRHTFALRQLTRYPSEQVARWLGVQDSIVMARYQRLLFQPIDVV